MLHNSKDILSVVNNVSGVSENTKTEVELLLKQDLLKDNKIVSALELGMFMAGIEEVIEDRDGFIKILTDMDDLSKLPFAKEN